MSQVTTYRAAIRESLREALQRDSRVFLMGEDVGRYGGTYAVSRGLLDEFGPERVRDTPLSELTFVGAGIGAALGGMRPIVEVMTVNFSLLALDPLMNTAATLRHMSGGQFSVPLVVRMATGAGRQLTGSALRLGGLAAIAGLGYQAWKNWQAGQSPQPADADLDEGDLVDGGAVMRDAPLRRDHHVLCLHGRPPCWFPAFCRPSGQPD